MHVLRGYFKVGGSNDVQLSLRGKHPISISGTPRCGSFVDLCGSLWIFFCLILGVLVACCTQHHTGLLVMSWPVSGH